MAKKTLQQPVTKKEENAADALMAALTNIGQAKAVEEKKHQSMGPRSLDRRSRFFFQPTISFTEDIERRKTVSLPREVEIVDEQIEARKKTYVKQFPPKLNRNLVAVREFWLNEIAPLTLAAQAGSDQARDVINRTLNAEVDARDFMQFQLMIQKGATLKLARYVAKYLKLPVADVEAVLDSVAIHRPQKEIVYVQDSDRRARAAAGNLTPPTKQEDDDE